MTIHELRDAVSCRHGRFGPDDCSPARLLLDEVRAAGLPAYFFDHGEQLVYLDGELYDLAAADETAPRPLAHTILESGVGIEFGWHHTGRCACRFCRPVQGMDAQDAVA